MHTRLEDFTSVHCQNPFPCPVFDDSEAKRNGVEQRAALAVPRTPQLAGMVAIIGSNRLLHRAVARMPLPEGSRVELYLSTQDYLETAKPDEPCCLLVEAHGSDKAALFFLRLIAEGKRIEQVVVLAGHDDADVCARAFRAGATDFIAVPCANRDLQRAIEEALQRSQRLVQFRRENAVRVALLQHLTPREREVLDFVIGGRPNKITASELGTTEKTIKKHRGRIMQKLQVGSLAELVFFSVLSGIKPVFAPETKVH